MDISSLPFGSVHSLGGAGMAEWFDFRTWSLMWVEFVVGSFPCSGRFFSATPVFPCPQKPAFPNISIQSGECPHLVPNLLY